MAFFTHAAISVSTRVFAERCTESYGSEGFTFARNLTDLFMKPVLAQHLFCIVLL